MISFGFSVRDEVTPMLSRQMAALSSSGLVRLNQRIARAVQQRCRQHVDRDAGTRHSTAEALGASPTGFLRSAAQCLHIRADASGADVDADHPWFARAFGPADILPSKQYLTIPVSADSYGARIKDFPEGFFLRLGGRKALYFARNGRFYHGGMGGLQLLFLLVQAVHQDQDRSRLPSDEELLNAALGAVDAYFAELGEENGGAQ